MLLLTLLACGRTVVTDASTPEGFWPLYETEACALSCPLELPLQATCDDLEDARPSCLWFDAVAAQACVDGSWSCEDGAPAACDLVCNVPPEVPFDPDSALPGLPAEPTAHCESEPGWTEGAMLATSWGTHVTREGVAHHVFYIVPNAAAQTLGAADCSLRAEGVSVFTEEGADRFLEIGPTEEIPGTCGSLGGPFEPDTMNYRLTAGEVRLVEDGSELVLASYAEDADSLWWAHPLRCQAIDQG